MTHTDNEYFKKLLLDLRNEYMEQWEDTQLGLSSNIKESSGEISSYSFHLADMGTDAMEREKAFWLASLDSDEIQEVNYALEKIAKGNYGICEKCGESISHKRLEALPYARLCLECKANEEIEQL